MLYVESLEKLTEKLMKNLSEEFQKKLPENLWIDFLEFFTDKFAKRIQELILLVGNTLFGHLTDRVQRIGKNDKKPIQKQKLRLNNISEKEASKHKQPS